MLFFTTLMYSFSAFSLQARSLEKQNEIRSQKIQESQQRIEETWSLAREETAKCKAAKEVIKALALRVNCLFVIILGWFDASVVLMNYYGHIHVSNFTPILSFILLSRMFKLRLHPLTLISIFPFHLQKLLRCKLII